MPIYEYQCQSCNQVTEQWQRMSDQPLTTCSHCGGELTKLISQSSFHLKGGGWYVSEYGRGNSSCCKSDAKPADKAEPSEAPKKADSTGAKTDA